MPMRNEASTWALYLPCSDSAMTSPNQRPSTSSTMNRPRKNTGSPQAWPFIQLATPIMVVNSAIEPRKGQPLWCGT